MLAVRELSDSVKPWVQFNLDGTVTVIVPEPNPLTKTEQFILATIRDRGLGDDVFCAYLAAVNPYHINTIMWRQGSCSVDGIVADNFLRSIPLADELWVARARTCYGPSVGVEEGLFLSWVRRQIPNILLTRMEFEFAAEQPLSDEID